MNYKEAGVDIALGNQFVRSLISNTSYPPEVISGIGGFCSLYRLPDTSILLAASCDGVGTKLKLAQQFKELGYLKTIGIDLVAMVVNDLITSGARPLFFLDYLSLSDITKQTDELEDIIFGIKKGCQEAGICLIGGETAEHPRKLYLGDLDVAGFGVGLVEEDNVLGPDRVREGDILLGIVSSGVHSNGFSLIRSLFPEVIRLGQNQQLLSSLMAPTIIYVKDLLEVYSVFKTSIHAAAHITGEGLEHNISRVVPDELIPIIDWDSFATPLLFLALQELGQIETSELRRVFNCGIGFVLVVDSVYASAISRTLQRLGQFTVVIGSVQKKSA